MTRHIDRERARLLARRDYLQRLVAEGVELDGKHEQELHDMDHAEYELPEIDTALAKLDEAATRGDDRPYPRVKIRKVPDRLTGKDYERPGGRPWLVTQVDAPELDEERVLGWQPDLPTAHGSATAYVQVQQHLARMIGGAL